ncbi:unnamed protein product [Ostreobium quekettii]|uniref:Uncharacterized protein n=1 Tax=Ostreobium quekettii TaxID=121088 RepID=A0A8S1IZ70_9CHLO|nr:unnamed protein product [Ostreobium quekettii]
MVVATGLMMVCGLRFRLFTTLEIGTGSANFVSAFLTFGSEDLPTRLPLIALSFIMSQGLLTMTFLGLFQPLSFRFHFPLQLCASAFLLSTLGLEVCRQTGTGGIPRTEWIFEELDAVVTWTTVPFAKLCEQLLLGADKYPCLQTVTWLLGRLRDGLVLKVEYPCLQMAMFLQGYVGFGVISYFVWLSERRSRVIFIQRLRSDVRPTEPIKPLDWSAVFRHTFYFFAAYVILWKIFLIFAPRIINWGM